MPEQTKQRRGKSEPKTEASPLETLIGPVNIVVGRLADSAARNPLLAGLLLLAFVPTILVIVAFAVMNRMPPTSFLLGCYGSAVPIAAVVAFAFSQSQRRKRSRSPRKITNTVELARGLSATRKGDIRKSLETECKATAAAFELPEDKVRACVFGIDRRRRIHMIPELTTGDYKEGEKTITMRLGEGVVGHCFASESPLMVVLESETGYWLDQAEQMKLHENLAWVIAVPVKLAGRTIWVISVSGLQSLSGQQFGQILERLQQKCRDLGDIAEAACAG